MPWPKTVATHYHAQLRNPNKGRAIKGLVICYEVGQGYMQGMGLRTSTARGSSPLLWSGRQTTFQQLLVLHYSHYTVIESFRNFAIICIHLPSFWNVEQNSIWILFSIYSSNFIASFYKNLKQLFWKKKYRIPDK